MKRELLRMAGGLLFVLALNGAYSIAAAREGDLIFSTNQRGTHVHQH